MNRVALQAGTSRDSAALRWVMTLIAPFAIAYNGIFAAAAAAGAPMNNAIVIVAELTIILGAIGLSFFRDGLRREDIAPLLLVAGIAAVALIGSLVFERPMIEGVRNALIPVITVIGVSLTVLFAGSVIIETIFQWPGIGMMFINSISLRDSPVIMGYVLVSAFVVLIANLLTDVVYSWVDPRIRYE